MNTAAVEAAVYTVEDGTLSQRGGGEKHLRISGKLCRNSYYRSNLKFGRSFTMDSNDQTGGSQNPGGISNSSFRTDANVKTEHRGHRIT